MDIALVAEGTYPYHMGGVSVWCDQLIRGMPEHRFGFVALTVDGTERSAWEEPENLEEVTNLPLWTPQPGRTGWPVEPERFVDCHRAFLRAISRPPPTDIESRRRLGRVFLRALRGLYEYARVADMGAAMRTNESLTRMIEIWESEHPARRERLSLNDALTVAALIEHMLRPLSAPPIRAGVCHAAMNGLSMLVPMASRWAFGTPIVMSEHGIYLRERYIHALRETQPHAMKVLLLNFFRLLATAGYQAADVIALHSRYNHRWALHNGASPDRIRTMYNGVDPDDFPLASQSPEAPTVVFMGRVDPIKDLHTLIRGFAVAHDKVPGAQLRMFGPTGEGRYHSSCVGLISDLGVDGAARFEGPVSSPVHAYHAGHVVALTSISEGFPYTVVEAMSCGRPTVVTNVGGVAEAVGDAGIVVPPRDYDAVGSACTRLLTDTPLRTRLGEAARARVLENFTLEQSIDAYRAIYADLGARREVAP